MKERRGYICVPKEDNSCVWACVACYFTGVATAILAVGYIAFTLS